MTPESNAPSMDPHIVGNAFVLKYYTHLYKSPEEVHKFYLEESMLGRPALDVSMVSVKSLKSINDQIMSTFDYQNSKIQILSADSQASLNNGVVTLVTGLVFGKDGERKNFTQTFFLVPQNGSYFVLNDVFRYVSYEFVEPEESTEESPQVTESIIAEPANATVNAIENDGNAEVHKEKVVVVNGNSNLPKAAEAKPQEEAPKRSFAAIVQSQAQNGTQAQNVKASPAKPKPVAKPRVVPDQPKAPATVPCAETINEQPGQGSSIFVANLPMDATPEQLYETFKDFGPIRKGGIQVRSYTEKRNCFGFVAFETREAIKLVFQTHKESPIRIGNRRTSIEEQRAGNNNENGGKASARNNGYNRNENGYRNNGNRPRGNGSNGGRGFGRNGVERRNGDATGDVKASQVNGHGNAQARN